MKRYLFVSHLELRDLKNAIVSWLCRCLHHQFSRYGTETLQEHRLLIYLYLIISYGFWILSSEQWPKPWLCICYEYRGCFTTLLYIYISIIRIGWISHYTDPIMNQLFCSRCSSGGGIRPHFNPTRGEPASVRRTSVGKHKLRSEEVLRTRCWSSSKTTRVPFFWGK